MNVSDNNIFRVAFSKLWKLFPVLTFLCFDLDLLSWAALLYSFIVVLACQILNSTSVLQLKTSISKRPTWITFTKHMCSTEKGQLKTAIENRLYKRCPHKTFYLPFVYLYQLEQCRILPISIANPNSVLRNILRVPEKRKKGMWTHRKRGRTRARKIMRCALRLA